MPYDWIHFFCFIGVLILITPLLGNYMASVFNGKLFFGRFFFYWLENFCYRTCNIDPNQEMTWVEYSKTLLSFNVLGFIFLFFLQIFQDFLPLNPQKIEGVSWPLAFNIAASFTTNTNWQSYSGETTLSYLTQMLGLTSQNFLSASTGMATLLALGRGLANKTTQTLGNVWVDLIRTVIYLFLPLSLLFALILVQEGIVQTFSPYTELSSLENNKQTVALGPVASQIAIKQLGTNGGGFFTANSSHPFENPTPFSNFLEMLALLLIPSSSIYMYGILINAKKQARLLFFTLLILFIGSVALVFYSEQLPNPLIQISPLLEGKETRLGTGSSLLWSTATTASANGSVNAMLSSLSPLAGGVALFNIMLGELIFGSVGIGLCSLIMFILLTVFLSGLMTGRTPEYLGKKIEKEEIKWVMLAVLTPGCLILLGSAISCVFQPGLSSLTHLGPHGLSEILYAFTSTAGNNGSAFSSLNANTAYYNLFLGLIMLFARLAILIPSLAIAGSLAKKKITPHSVGTFSTHSLLFAILLTCIIFTVGALTFFPALSLGPIVEQLLLLEGRAF